MSLRHSYNYHIIWHFHRGSWITWIAIRRIKQLRKHRILLVQPKEGSSKLLNYTVWLLYEYRATRNCEWSDKRIEIQCKDAIIKSQELCLKNSKCYVLDHTHKNRFSSFKCKPLNCESSKTNNGLTFWKSKGVLLKAQWLK